MKPSPAAAILATLVLCLAAQARAVTIEPLSPRPDARRPVQLVLSDLPPSPCPWQLDSVAGDADTVVLRLAHADGCSGAAQQARLEIQPPGLAWGRSGVARVRVEAAGSQPRLLGFGLVEVGRVVRSIHPEPGYWWNEIGGAFDSAGPGLGLNLERQGDTLSVTVLGYAEDGRPEWLFGAGPIHGHVARVPLSRLQDGAGPFAPWQAPGKAEPGGVVHFEFLSEARATAWFEQAQRNAIRLQPLSLVRFRFDEQASGAALGEWLFVGGISLGDPHTHSATLVFDRSEATSDGFRLSGDPSAPSLECALDPERPNSPPARCVLSDARGQLLVDFQDIALGRMRGWRPDGAAVTALHRPAD